MRLEKIDDTDSLARLSDPWRNLLRANRKSNTFHTPEWLLSWWEGYQPAARVSSIAGFENNVLVALAPLMSLDERHYGIPVRCLRFIGDGSHETDHMDLILAADGAAQSLDLLLQGVNDLPWDLAVFCNVPESSPTCDALTDWVKAGGLMCRQNVTEGPTRSLPDSFDALLASMPSRFRTSVRSTRRKLASAYKIEFGLHDAPAEFAAALQSLFTNHESRWRARGQSGVFANEKRRRFYRTLTARLHAAGNLRFFYLKLDGRIVAQEYCFQHDGTVYLLQEGFDFSLAKENIGNALRSYVFEYLIENGYKAYDFLGGVTRHKLNWSDGIARDVTFTIARPTLRGALAFQIPVAIERGKALLRPLRDSLRKTFSGGPGAPVPGRDMD